MLALRHCIACITVLYELSIVSYRIVSFRIVLSLYCIMHCMELQVISSCSNPVGLFLCANIVN